MTDQERLEHLRKIGRRGGLARARAFTPKYQRDARANVSSQSCARNGAKGYAALVAAGKGDLASKIAADYRFNNPSDLEQIVMGWLEELVVGFDRSSRAQREVQVGSFWVDFLFKSIYVVEVYGDAWHVNGHFQIDGVAVKGDVEAKDRAKREYLEAHGYDVTVLTEADINSGAAYQTVKQLAQIINSEVEF